MSSDSKLVNMDDVELIHKKNVSELIELLNILNAEVLTKTHEISKDLRDSGTQITVSKEELSSKLEVLDKYFTKLEIIQKQVLGDKSIEKKYQEVISKIESKFENAIKKIESKFDDKEKILDKKIESFKTDNEKIIEIGKDGIKKDKEVIKGWMEQILTTLDVKGISTHASTLLTSATALKEAINEQNAIKKAGIKPFLAGIFLSSILFGIGIYLNSIMHFF